MKSAIDWYVSNKVREIRQDKGISQLNLAIQLDISVGFVGKIESPKYPSHYNLKHLNELARILRCSPKDFLPSQPV